MDKKIGSDINFNTNLEVNSPHEEGENMPALAKKEKILIKVCLCLRKNLKR